MTINTNIDLGSIIAAVSVIVTLLALHRQNVSRIVRIEVMVETLWNRSGISQRYGRLEHESDER